MCVISADIYDINRQVPTLPATMCAAVYAVQHGEHALLTHLLKTPGVRGVRGAEVVEAREDLARFTAEGAEGGCERASLLGVAGELGQVECFQVLYRAARGQATRARAAAALCFVTVQGHGLEPLTVGYMVYEQPGSFPDLWGGEESYAAIAGWVRAGCV